jgi:unsaturated rhamnogalacturonyl hydrolase
MQRRFFIQQTLLSSGALILMPIIGSAFSFSEKKYWRRIQASGVNAPEIAFPREKRIPLDWKAFPVPATTNSKPAILQFPFLKSDSDTIWFRITAAIDFREELIVSAFLPESGKEIGQFDIRFAHPFQPFEIPVNSSFLDEIGKQGIALRMIKGQKDAWFFQPDLARTDNQGLQPHLLVGKNEHHEIAFRENMLSMNSFAPFGWIGGCVFDALWEMSETGDQEALRVLKKQLSYFLDEEKGIIFENPMTEPKDGTFNSIEDFLPLVAITGLYPNHPSIQMALDFLKTKENPEGIILSGNDITTEACYTVAYPLAALAVNRNNRELAQIALKQLRFRTIFLVNKNKIHQRSTLSGHQTFSNWGRGITWYLLGTVKTLKILKESTFNDLNEIKEVENDFIQAIEMVYNFQSKDGLWYSFIDRPETGVDTSASAGIAKAFVLGFKLGLLDSAFQEKAKMAYKSLQTYLTVDGFLTGVSQINRGGEELQSSGYRVISQFGMGLFAQLENQLEK